MSPLGEATRLQRICLGDSPKYRNGSTALTAIGNRPALPPQRRHNFGLKRMAGPTCSVLSPAMSRPGSSADALVGLVASVRDGDSFWVHDTRPIGGTYTGAGRPFLLFREPRGEGELRALEKAIGWMPAQEIGLAAMTNTKDDHRILAELAIWLAERDSGLVDFGGDLPPVSQVVEQPSSEVGQPSFAVAHIADPRSLRAWLLSSEFRMVK